MLDLLPVSPECSTHRVPMDFSPYLLSASPPSSSFDFMGYAGSFSFPHSNTNGQSLTVPSFCPHHQTAINTSATLNQRRNGPLKSIIIKTESLSLSDSDTESTCSDGPQSPGRSQKKVSFADHKGLALAHVRLVKEGPDEPPQLSQEILSTITKGVSAEISLKPPLKLCFSQPASDYLAFRDKISSNLISLENVILRDYTVEGTIKVKNICFEKSVFLRISLDEWETFEDITSTYVPGPGSGGDQYDTFTFSTDISPSFDVAKRVQFAVCFEEGKRQHWDNNSGENYCIVSEHYESSQPKKYQEPKFNPRWLPEKQNASWADYSSWRDISCETPYY